MGLLITNLNQHYSSSHTLKNVSLTTGDRNCIAVLGRNGSGKTTLLKCLMGVLPVSSGAIVYNGRNLTYVSPDVRVRAGLGYVPQGREIFADLTVGENVEIALAAGRLQAPEPTREELLTTFPVIRHMWRRRAGNLSGGQQQQLSIARALATGPELLILDEPTEGIQPSIVQRIEDVIGQLKSKIGILLVEQYLDFARSIADSYLVLSRGEVAAAGPTGDMDVNKVRKLIAI